MWRESRENPAVPKLPETGIAGKGIGRLSLVGIIADLLGDDFPLVQRNEKREAAALAEVLKTLRAHPLVAWCEGMNSGAAKIGARFVRFGWTGCPDVLGQMKDGRLLGVEVKAEKGRLRPEQAIFLERIRCAGGVAFVARNCLDVLRALGEPTERAR